MNASRVIVVLQNTTSHQYHNSATLLYVEFLLPVWHRTKQPSWQRPGTKWSCLPAASHIWGMCDRHLRIWHFPHSIFRRQITKYFATAFRILHVKICETDGWHIPAWGWFYITSCRYVWFLETGASVRLEVNKHSQIDDSIHWSMWKYNLINWTITMTNFWMQSSYTLSRYSICI